jgi:hypothetical protein
MEKKKPFIVNIVIIFVLVLIALLFVRDSLGSLSMLAGLRAVPSATPQVTLQATATLKPTEAPTRAVPTYDPDPIIKCNIAAQCGGSTIELRQSVCNNSICCGFQGGKWVFYTDKNKCLSDQKSGSVSDQNFNNSTINTQNTGSFDCLVSWPCTGESKIFKASDQSQCSMWQKSALDTCQAAKTPPPTVDNTAYNQCIKDIQAQLDTCNQKCEQSYQEISQSGEYNSSNMLDCYSTCGQQYSYSKCSN